MVASKSDRFFQEEEVEEQEFKKPEHAKEEVQEDWQVLQLRQVKPFY